MLVQKDSGEELTGHGERNAEADTCKSKVSLAAFVCQRASCILQNPQNRTQKNLVRGLKGMPVSGPSG